ncbi:MAG: hypothetical protein RL071_3978 [Pseudomonadota bacterium]
MSASAPPPAPLGLPPAASVDPGAFARDRATVFAHAWLCLGASAEWPVAGAAAARDQGGRSIVALRHTDGGLRAFANVCPHRAGPLLWPGEDRPAGQGLRCRYHGWRFDQDGALVGTPDFDGQRVGASALAAGCRLSPLPTAEAAGLVWVWLGTGAPDRPAPGAAGPLAGALAALGLDRWRPRARASHPLACDWKVYVENYLEGYHIPYLHPGLGREIDMGGYAVEVDGDTVRHVVPTRPGAVNEGLWLWVWPNLAINVYGGACSIERMLPLGPGAARIDYVYLADDSVSDDAFAEMLRTSATTTAEDVRIVEQVQRGLHDPAAAAGPLSPRHEAGLAHFHALLRAAWGGG